MDYQDYLRYRSDILDWISLRLKKSRYTHTLGVEQTAVTLARKFGQDPNLASLAALLHDNAKNLDLDEQFAICKKAYPKKFSLTMDYASILHAFAGAEEAIRYHTTGRPGMSDLEKIIYCADFIEPNREPFEGLDEARKQVFSNLDDGLCYILRHTTAYINGKGKKLYPLTTKAMKYYKIVEESTNTKKK